MRPNPTTMLVAYKACTNPRYLQQPYNILNIIRFVGLSGIMELSSGAKRFKSSLHSYKSVSSKLFWEENFKSSNGLKT